MNRWAEFLGRSVRQATLRVADSGSTRLRGDVGRRVIARLRTRLVAMVMFAGSLFFVVPSQAVDTPSREYDVKAALLFNLTRFVEWPADVFPQADSPIVIGILGQDPFGSALDEIVRNEKWAGRPITVERCRHVEAAGRCQILFVAASEEAELPHIMRMLRGRPVLTVGDFEGFALRGGMILLMKEPAGKIFPRINLEAVKTSGLIVSAKLLRVAEVVGTPEK